MITLTMQKKIGIDRQLTIALPQDVQEGPADIVVILNPLSEATNPKASSAQLETTDIRARLKSFEKDWESPGMEAYDEL